MLNQEERWLLEEKYGGEKSAAFFADCERLAVGEPLGYIIGHVPFLNTTISLDGRPLIPRPETEYWVEKAIAEITTWQQLHSTARILDLCAGSGAIGVAVAKAVPEARVDFAEIDTRLLPTIKKNLSQNDIDTTRYQLFASNLFSHTDTRYDFILTNPPYIDHAANTVEHSVAAHEPHLALFGGEGGMEVIARIIEGARAKLAPPTHTSPGGQLWIEHEPTQTSAISTLAAKHGFKVTTHKDQYGVERYSLLVLE